MAVLLRRAAAAALLVVVAAVCADGASTFYSSDPNLGSARVVFQTNYGDIEFGFFPRVAPKTVEHIFKLVRLGGYNTNHFFRVDKGFVAQVADVMSGRTAPMNAEQKREAEKTIVGEFSTVKHVRGILSMGRHSDPDSAGSSFSILLGDAPHLDGQYAVFGRVTKGDDILSKLERLPTRREGIFVMPIERIDILSTYYYDIDVESCEAEKSILRRRLSESASEVERWVSILQMLKTTRPYAVQKNIPSGRLMSFFFRREENALLNAVVRRGSISGWGWLEWKCGTWTV